MFYTTKQLIRKLKRSKNFIMMCIDRYGIKRIKLKSTRQLVYDIPKEKMELIIQFSEARQRRERRNRKINKRSTT